MPEPNTSQQLFWQRPLDIERALAVLRQWATDQRSPHIVLDAVFQKRAVTYVLRVNQAAASALVSPLCALTNTIVRPFAGDLPPVMIAGRIKSSTRHRPLRTTDPEAIVRGILAAGIRVRGDETLRLQLILGPRRIPLAVPNASPPSLVRPWWSIAWSGDRGQIDGEKRQALRSKVSDHGFACTLRLGVSAKTPARRQALLLSLLAAIRTCEAPGVQLRLRREPADRLNQATAPRIWPLRLGVGELLGLTSWPLGDKDLPGQPAPHPTPLPPPAGTTGTERIDAGESARSADRPELQRMLSYLTEQRDIDYVIVHKVDRLARNRADDVAINLAISKAGATLVSCTENIDETPSGILLHGIMSSIAEFYSRNLANEVSKGHDPEGPGRRHGRQGPTGLSQRPPAGRARP
jgi:Resolvase, N terminal domain